MSGAEQQRTGLCSTHRDGEDPACSTCYPPRAEQEAVERRRAVAREVGIGWVEMSLLPIGKYQVLQRDDGWHVYGYDEQQAGWDRDHGIE